MTKNNQLNLYDEKQSINFRVFILNLTKKK